MTPAQATSIADALEAVAATLRAVAADDFQGSAQIRFSAVAEAVATVNARLSRTETEALGLNGRIVDVQNLLADIDARLRAVEGDQPPKPAPEPGPEPATPEPGPAPDPLAAIRRPPAGKLWMGATNTSGVTQHHTIAGRRAHWHHGYSRGPTEFVTRLAATPVGTLPFLCFKPTGTMGEAAYDRILVGGVDDALDTAADACRAYGKPMAVAFNHEPENDVKNPADFARIDGKFAQAFRHCVHHFRNRSVTNVLYVVNFMGFTDHFPRMDVLYPGDDVVDIIAIDPYCHDATQTLATFGVMKGAGQRYHDWALPHGKPIWWAEWGIDRPTAATIAARILTQAGLDELRARQPLLAGMFYWNEWLTPSTDPVKDYRLSNFAAAWKAFASLPTFDFPVPAGAAKS